MRILLPGLALILFICAGCSTPARPVTDKGLDIAGKIRVLKDYMALKSAVTNAAFSLYDVNHGSRGIPGPTHRDYRVLLMVDPADVPLWTNGLMTIKGSLSQEMTWVKEILGKERAAGLPADGWMSFAPAAGRENPVYWIHRQKGLILFHYTQF